MQAKTAGVTLAVLGGDKRDLILVEALGEKGYNLRVFGLPIQTSLNTITVSTNITDACVGVDGIILPMPGVNNEGKIYAPLWNGDLLFTEELMQSIPAQAPIFLGVAKKYIIDLACKYQRRLVEIADNDELAILNAIPSAEGAIQYAMTETQITIHGSSCFVLGHGRVGMTLSRILHALGARVTVMDKSAASRARAIEMGIKPCPPEELPSLIAEADIIFNTIPSLVLIPELLCMLKPTCLILDLASLPGGTDFEYCKAHQIKAQLLPGLPGKVAPITAGRILASVLPNLLAQEMILNKSS